MPRSIVSILSLSGVSRAWRLAVCASLGVLLGAAVVLMRLSNAVSYLSDAPLTCMNCHVMTDAYASWQRGSHARVAVCVDCHVPHDNLAAKLAFKATDGMKHSYVYTLRIEPQVLSLSEPARPVVQGNCVRCHARTFWMVRLTESRQRRCWDCHQGVHGAAQSLSASHRALRPPLPPAGLEWMKKGDQP
jgi:cytochrome c nitrite reductase small subunit